MGWNKITINTLTSAEDMISYELTELGAIGVEVEDHVPLTEEEMKVMYVDLLPDEIAPDDGKAKIHCYFDEEENLETITIKIQAMLHRLQEFMDIGEGTITFDKTQEEDWVNNWKNGIYRTGDTGLGKPNGDSPRPYPVLKFSELYLIAAEAAVKGATVTGNFTAYNLVNVLRARAGKWTYDNNRQREKVADYSAQMVAATPQTITIDYILEERSREFFGEGYRWLALVRTQSWQRLHHLWQERGRPYPPDRHAYHHATEILAAHTAGTDRRPTDDRQREGCLPESQLRVIASAC
jgi:hypothetical protein